MQRDSFRDLSSDTMQRVEAGHRLLEHDAGHIASRTMQCIGIGADHLLLAEQDAA